MNKVKCLEVTQPIIASNTEHGYLLSGVQTSSLSTPWLMNNFIHQVVHGINLKPDMNFYPIVDHVTCPCIDYLRISKEIISKKWSTIIEFLTEHIDKNYYIIIHLDWYYVSSSYMYESVHYEHPVLIYGYNKMTNEFNIGDFDKNKKFSFTKLVFNEVENGFYSNRNIRKRTFNTERFLYIDDIILYRNRSSMNYEIKRDIIKNGIFDYMTSKNVSLRYAMGDYSYFNSAVFGIDALDMVRKLINIGIDEVKDYKIKYKFISVPLERTNLMRERIKLLGLNDSRSATNTIQDQIEEIYTMYLNLKYITIKFNLSKEKELSSKAIDNILRKIINKEKKFYTELFDLI